MNRVQQYAVQATKRRQRSTSVRRPAAHSLADWARQSTWIRPRSSPYTRADFSSMPLFDQTYVNPALAIKLGEVSVQATDVLKRRLHYINKPGLGDQGNTQEITAIKAELKRRK